MFFSERRPLKPEELARFREVLERRLRECESRGCEKSGLPERIRQALARMERGEYGRCVDCGQWLRLKRLETVPWAERCRACQERWEMLSAVE
ncbi:hypothetical protein FVE67_03420 [Thermosulfurimonas marina]|uniref:Zinc finger DksA/TraR C4-type domain-containing protein n=1 Tax=Thermosulfurimonas marina TaxID=2047767 RepID=A0A6H1WRT4_9BACT|nr:TraR/DksA C4-type zinc finger protein [Thermosulfurimonas marina]QJA05903.1 hypothetical protein FVE67_03420 [Thermosulfurimonas marina]